MISFPYPTQSKVPLKSYTYLKCGGPAEYLYVAQDQTALVQMIIAARSAAIPLTILGGGSNVLISDHGLPGLTIINRTSSLNFTETTVNGEKQNLLTAASGVPLSRVVNYANDHSLSGLAPFLGVPGSLGGAVYNNSHYQQQLIGENIISVDVLTETNQQQTLEPKDLEFAYDYSRFHHTQEIILNATFCLPIGDSNQLKQQALAALNQRKASQPLEYPSSGCTFRNLSPKVQTDHQLPTPSVGYLIDTLGLKGKQIGDAAVSTKHANFIVNLGAASAQNVYDLAQFISQAVYQHYQIQLTPEVFFLGDFKTA